MVKSGSFTSSLGSAAGRIGSALGQGLGEQIPKEVAQQRLAKGLENVSQNANNLTPLQAAAKIFSIPGITPQMAQVLPELLRLQSERQKAIEMSSTGISGNQETGINQTQEENGTFNNQQAPTRNKESVFDINQYLGNQRKGITTQAPIQAALSDIRQPTQQEIFDKRSDYIKQMPWLSVPAATTMAEDYFQRLNSQKTAQIEKGARQENVQAKTDQTFEKEFNLLTKKQKEAISGESFADMRDAAREEVSLGLLTPDQAAKKYARLALAVDENRNHLDQMAETPLFLQKPHIIQGNIKQASKLWSEANRSKELSNNLQSKFGITAQMSDSFAFPVNEMKGISQLVESYKPSRPTGLTGLPNTEETTNKSIKLANDISKSKLDRNVSFNSIITHLKDKDPFFDDTSFIDQLRNLYEQGLLQVDARQREELINRKSTWIPNLNDLYFKIAGKFKG